MNSSRSPRELGVMGHFRIATADALNIAQRLRLLVAGNAIVNTAMLGAFVRATGLVSLESIKRALESRFEPSAARLNMEAARLTHDATVLRPLPSGEADFGAVSLGAGSGGRLKQGE